MMVPRAIGAAVEGMLSVDRIADYLQQPDVTPLEDLGRARGARRQYLEIWGNTIIVADLNFERVVV